MKHFRKIKDGIDVEPFLIELRTFEGSWDLLRAVRAPVQKETLNIPLRKGIDEVGKRFEDCHRSSKTEWYACFPKLSALLERVALELRGELSRVMIVNLKPKGRVYRHLDSGEYYKIRNRYHLVLYSKGGSRMQIEDEEILFQEGELWWYDNKSHHESYNDSDTDRVHVIFDVLPLEKSIFKKFKLLFVK